MDQVATAESLSSVYGSALDCLRSILEVDRASVLVLDRDATMRFVAWNGLSERYRVAVEGHSPWRADATDAAPVLVSDVKDAPELASYLGLFAHENIGALAFVPLCFGSKLLGKFMLYYAEPHVFAAEEIAVAETIAGHVAFALEHHRIASALEERLGAERDLRRLAESEAALRHENERRLHLALASGCMGTWDWDIASGRVAWSTELEAIHGLAPGSFGGTLDAFHADVHPEDRARLQSTVEAALETRQSDYAIEYRIVPPDRRLRWVAAKGRVLYDAEGHPVRMAGVCSDVSERKRDEEARCLLEDASRILATTLDSDAALKQLAARVVATMADYCVTYAWDGDAIRRLGLAHRDPTKLPLVEALTEVGAPKIEDRWGAGAAIRTREPIWVAQISAQLLESSAQSARHLEAVRALGPLSAMVVPLEARGRILGAIAFATTADSGRLYDRNDLRVAGELASRVALLVDNARLYVQARDALRARDEMIAVVSHDLRNPLQSISAAASLLQFDPTPERRARGVQSIALASAQMDRLLLDLLDISRMDAGEFSVTMESVDVVELIDEARLLFQHLAEDKTVCFECETEEGLPPIAADRGRVLQVLMNLLGNALKFVPGGGRIVLTAAYESGAVRLSVADTGVGIAEEDLGRVFNRFWRADTGKSGAGLGLAVAKGIVEAHGGRIGVESRLGGGSTFHISLRTAIPDGTERYSPAPPMQFSEDARPA